MGRRVTGFPVPLDESDVRRDEPRRLPAVAHLEGPGGFGLALEARAGDAGAPSADR